MACCRRWWPDYSDDQCRTTIEVAERYADGLADREELRNHFSAAYGLWRTTAELRPGMRHDPFAVVAACAANGDAHDAATTASWDSAFDPETHRPRVSEFAYQGDIARCIFGNPFRPIAFDPRWRTEDAVGLARGIYEDRAFDRLPLLGDALMDAGCDDEQVLAHCRDKGPHVRGCWVVDLVLGKE